MSLASNSKSSIAKDTKPSPKKRRLFNPVLPNMSPSIQYHNSISAEEFDAALSQTIHDQELALYKQIWSAEPAKDSAYSYSWQSLWKLMLYIFGCSPWDLQTWGLRLSSEEKEKTVKLLVHLLPHPVWECRVDILRYVLQKTVAYRLKSKLEPLGPLPPGIGRGIFEAELPFKTVADTALAMWKENNPGHNYNISQLLGEISKRAAISKAPVQSAKLFIVEPADVMIVGEALDALSQDVLPPYTIDQYWDSFVRQHSSWPCCMAPYNAETVARWDRLSVAEKEYRREACDVNIPPKERKDNVALGMWNSKSCDPRAKKMIIRFNLADKEFENGPWVVD